MSRSAGIFSKNKALKSAIFPLLVIMTISQIGCMQEQFSQEHQITYDFLYNHDLDNNDNFSPDDQWLVYDTRTEEGGIGANGKIEKVNLRSGEKVILYELKENTEYGPGVGAASYNHKENEVIFIRGLLNCSVDAPYEQWRRTGIIVKDTFPGKPINMDARDISFPFTKGALRGGTHRHEFSGDGQWIGFTYNDALMKKLEDSTGIHYNLRTIGVSKKGQKVTVSGSEPDEDFTGEWFSAVVVNVVPEPLPNSNEISGATGDSWVGNSGYIKADGTRQRARAFIGTVKDGKGKNIDEVFVVDIPENIMTATDDKLLEGTRTRFPMPPKGTLQRRLTHTADHRYPGCEGIVRSSSDGSLLAFLSFDENHIKQVFTISPRGGTPAQETFHASDVQSGIRWHPEEHRICYVWNNSIVTKKIGQKNVDILTAPSPNAPSNLVWSHDGRTIAYNRILSDPMGKTAKQIFIISSVR